MRYNTAKWSLIIFWIPWLIALEGGFFLYALDDSGKWDIGEVIGCKGAMALLSGLAIVFVSLFVYLIKETYLGMSKFTKEQWISCGKWALIVIGIIALIIGYFYFNYKMANKLGKKRR